MKRNIKWDGMLVLRIAAFWLPVAGIGSIVGAVETGTSPAAAAAVFLIGCMVFAAYMKAENICWVGKGPYRKEREMGGLEKEELHTRMRGMTQEEQAIAARALEDGVLLEELCMRYISLREKVDSISKAMARDTLNKPDKKGGDSNGV